MSNALAANNTNTMRLKEQVKELERKVVKQGKILETKLDKLIASKRSPEPFTDDSSNKKVCRFVECWAALEHKFYSDPKMLVFNGYDSDVDSSYNELKQKKRKTK